MARPRDFLERFRASGTPGAAAGAGVPADRVAERSAELAPVLSLLDDTQEECRRILAAAQEEAQRRRAAGAERARQVVAAAGVDAQSERAAAAAAVREPAQAAATETAAAAQAEAAALRARAADRLPGYVDRVLDLVRAELDDLLTADRAGP